MKRYLTLMLLLTSPAYAYEGEIRATVIDPRLMPLHEARKFCYENPQALKCKKILEDWKLEEAIENHE